jgi:hypothetical protein
MPRARLSEAATVLKEICAADLNARDIVVSLAKATARSDVPNFERLSITDDLAGEFRTAIAKTLSQIGHELDQGDTVVVPYNSGSNPDIHEMEFVDLRAEEGLRGHLVAIDSPGELPVFDGTGRGITNLRFYTVTATARDVEPFHILRTYSHRKELGRSKVLAAVFQGGQYDRLREPIFLFDGNADCISQGDFIFIRRRDNFQRIFKYFEKLMAMGQSTLEVLREKLPIRNFDALSAACLRSPMMLAKLRSLANLQLFEKLSMPAMKATIDAYGLPIEIAVNGQGHEEIVFDAAHKWDFLRLIEDGYLKSDMTQVRYEVTGKRPR